MPKRPAEKAAGGDCQRAREGRPWACLMADQAKILDWDCRLSSPIHTVAVMFFLWNWFYTVGLTSGLSQEGFRRGWCTPRPVLVGEIHWFFGGSYSNLASWIRFFVPRTQRPFIPCTSSKFECYLIDPTYLSNLNGFTVGLRLMKPLWSTSHCLLVSTLILSMGCLPLSAG